MEGLIFDKTEVAKQLNKEFHQSFVSGDPVITSYIDKFYKESGLLIIDFINTGKQEGYVNKNLSTESIIFYFNMFKEAAYNPEIAKDPMELSKDLTTLLFYGLMGNTDKSEGGKLNGD